MRVTPIKQSPWTLDSSAYGLRATAGFGAATVMANYFQATNFTIFSSDSFHYGPSYDGTTMYDSDYTGMHASVSYKVNDMIKIQAGYGIATSERTIGANTFERERISTYVNVPITFAKGVTLEMFHEIDDHGEENSAGSPGVDQGEITYTGGRWKITF